MTARSLVALASVAALIVACGPKSEVPSKYPARQAGCDVTVYEDGPTVQTENIGTVSAVCAESTSDADCLRELKDQACKLGADVVWGVPHKPKVNQAGKLELSGRAAHTTSGSTASDAGS